MIIRRIPGLLAADTSVRNRLTKTTHKAACTHQGGCCVISVLFQHSRIKHIRLKQLSKTKVYFPT